MTKRILPIHDLSLRHPGVTTAIAAGYTEAARVCLDRHHVSPVDFSLERNTKIEATAKWNPTNTQTQNAWANETDTTEAGAYCVALAAVETTDGLVAIARAETKTGADYYLGKSANSLNDLEQAHRLEVSGVDNGAESILRARLRQKQKQATAGSSSLPAIAAVVGFSAKQVLIDDA